MQTTTPEVSAEKASSLMHQIASLASAQMQADWTGMARILKDVESEDLPVYGNVAAEMLAQAAHWNADMLEDGHEFDCVDRPMRAAAIAVCRGNSSRARILARGRVTPSEAAWVLVAAWNISEGSPEAALAKAQRVCAASADGVRLLTSAL